MEENLVGYLLESLDPPERQRVEEYLAESPEGQAQLELLRQALLPLSFDKDTIDPPADLAVRTIGLVAEHIVNAEGSVAEPGKSPVAEFLRSVGHREPPPLKLSEVPAYPYHGSEANPVYHRRRNVFATIGLSAAVLLIGITAIGTLRQVREVQACQNNMRAMHQAFNTFCDANGDNYPKVAPDEDVRTALVQMRKAGVMPTDAALTCPASDHNSRMSVYRGDVPFSAIDYAYTLGYRDGSELRGLVRNAENDEIPLFADAPERKNDQAMPINHRKGQNVLFAGGHVRFCTNPFVGPEIAGKGDDIYFNSVHEAHAGTFKLDVVLGCANERP